MPKKPEGKDWENFFNQLLEAESRFKGVEEEFEVLSAQMMTEAGYDPVEAKIALRAQAKEEQTELFKDAVVIDLDSPPAP